MDKQKVWLNPDFLGRDGHTCHFPVVHHSTTLNVRVLLMKEENKVFLLGSYNPVDQTLWHTAYYLKVFSFVVSNWDPRRRPVTNWKYRSLLFLIHYMTYETRTSVQTDLRRKIWPPLQRVFDILNLYSDFRRWRLTHWNLLSEMNLESKGVTVLPHCIFCLMILGNV